jgi:hypothetical protein
MQSPRFLHHQLGADLHAIANGARHRAMLGVKVVHALGGGLVFGGNLEVVGDVNAPDDQHVAVFANLPPAFRIQPAFAGGNPARFQRAAKGPRQSTGGGCN